MLFRSVSRQDFLAPLQAIAAGSWNLNTRLNPPKSKMCVAVGGLINNMFEGLQERIRSIAKNSVSLSTVAPRLAAVASDLDSGSLELTDKAGSIASSAKQLAEGVSQISESAHEVAEFSRKVTRAAEDARKSVENAESQMQSISQRSSELSTAIHSLSTESGNISGIVDMIKKIADQTNLLSLNASIEAARAGEHGRGFAVVATEIRALAAQTMEATQKVDSILASIRNGIKHSSGCAGTVSELVESGIEVTEKARSSMDTVLTYHATLDQYLDNITRTTEEQSAAVSQVAEGISTVAAVSEQQAAVAATLAGEVSSLNSNCDDLLLSLGKFRTSVHAMAEDAAEQIATMPEIRSMHPSSMEAAMRNAVRKYHFIELLYVTDARGRQVTENIYRSGSDDTSARGSDWSTRQWFTMPAKTGQTYITDIYRSSATGSFCFTVSIPVMRDGVLLGVLGLDVNFADLLD